MSHTIRTSDYLIISDQNDDSGIRIRQHAEQGMIPVSNQSWPHPIEPCGDFDSTPAQSIAVSECNVSHLHDTSEFMIKSREGI